MRELSATPTPSLKLTKLINTNLHSDAWEEAHESLEALSAATVEPLEALAAPPMLEGVESAKLLTERIGDVLFTETNSSQDAAACWIEVYAIIEADRAAVTRAAELALLKRIERRTSELVPLYYSEAENVAIAEIRKELTRE